MKSSDELEQQINRIENEISNLQGRRMEIDEELSELKRNLSANLNDEDTGQKIHELKSSRDTIDEVIEEKEETLEELQKELEKAEAKQRDQENFEKAVKLAKRTHEIRNEQDELIEKFDEVVEPIISQYLDNRSEWKASVSAFMQTISALEPTFHDSKNNKLDKEERRAAEKKRKKLIQKIEEEAGVSSKAARHDGFLNRGRNSFNEVVNTGLKIKDSKLGAFTSVRKLEKKRAQEARKKKDETAG